MTESNNGNGRHGKEPASGEMIDLNDLLSRISDSLITFDTVDPHAGTSSETIESLDPATLPADDISVPALEADLLRYLIITAGEKSYGLATEYVQEVVIEPAITPVPGLPDWILGVMNVHGDIASVVHLDRFLGGYSVVRGSNQPVVLAQASNQRIGLLVDNVRTIHTFPPEDIFSPPFKIASNLVPYLEGVIRNNDVIYLMNCESLLTGEAMQQFT